jgi:hypothetical protein
MKNRLWKHIVGAGLAMWMVNGCIVADPDPDDAGDGTDTGDGDGDGDGEPDIEQVCSDLCAVYDDCLGADPVCVQDCVDYLSGFADAECLASELQLTECLTGLTCQELDAFVNQTEPFPCQAEAAATCGEGECSVGVLGNSQNPGMCEVIATCQGQEQSIECDGMTCTCFVDGSEAGSCTDVLAICDEPSPEEIDACCG